jgi:hypothetical protein
MPRAQHFWATLLLIGAFDFSEGPFRSIRMVLTSQTKVVILF